MKGDDDLLFFTLWISYPLPLNKEQDPVSVSPLSYLRCAGHPKRDVVLPRLPTQFLGNTSVLVTPSDLTVVPTESHLSSLRP